MKSIFTLLFSFILLGLHAQTCAGRYQTEIYNQVDVTTVQYGAAVNLLGDTQILNMDIYEAVGDTAVDRPVVIFCFGGSFVGGSRTSGELVSFATSLAKKGYVCASIDYRLAGSAFELVQEEKMIKVVFSAVQDGKAAIRYFRKDFDEGNSLGINPDNIFIGGTSAGGILAINLAYVDSIHKLPCEWQDWAIENGGLEGSSGNPGYCSYPNGVFSFAGAVGDTSYIDGNDVPFYSCHATGDQTVKYGFGAPLQGFAPVDLYGSGNIATRLTNLGVYNVLDTYSGGDHPPLNGTNMATTNTNLTNFLYNIVDCNPSNQQKSNQQSCDEFYVGANVSSCDTLASGIRAVNANKDWSVYPNPAENIVTIEGSSNFDYIKIIDALGREVYSLELSNTNKINVEVQDFVPGVYYIQMLSEDVWATESLLVK